MGMGWRRWLHRRIWRHGDRVQGKFYSFFFQRYRFKQLKKHGMFLIWVPPEEFNPRASLSALLLTNRELSGEHCSNEIQGLYVTSAPHTRRVRNVFVSLECRLFYINPSTTKVTERSAFFRLFLNSCNRIIFLTVPERVRVVKGACWLY